MSRWFLGRDLLVSDVIITETVIQVGTKPVRTRYSDRMRIRNTRCVDTQSIFGQAPDPVIVHTQLTNFSFIMC